MPDVSLKLCEVISALYQKWLLHLEVAANVRNEHVQGFADTDNDLLLLIKIEQMLISFKLEHLLQLSGLGVKHSENVIVLSSKEHFEFGREV